MQRPGHQRELQGKAVADLQQQPAGLLLRRNFKQNLPRRLCRIRQRPWCGQFLPAPRNCLFAQRFQLRMRLEPRQFVRALCHNARQCEPATPEALLRHSPAPELRHPVPSIGPGNLHALSPIIDKRLRRVIIRPRVRADWLHIQKLPLFA